MQRAVCNMNTVTTAFRTGEIEDSELYDTVQEPLDYGDHRSPRMRALLALGVAAERGLGETVYNNDELDSETVNLVQQAVAEAVATGDAPDDDPTAIDH